MKISRVTFILVAILFQLQALSQLSAGGVSLSYYAGMINYHGDLNPHSFTFSQANFAMGLVIRKPITSWLAVRGGAFTGKVDAADRNNRDYLKPRNLSFISTIHEIHAGLEISLTNLARSRITPYIYGSIAVFNFNPWTYDNSGKKTFLKPLSTEGQGLSQYPSQKEYSLTQWSIPFGGGFKIEVNDQLRIGLEFSQRKTFTDYLDDVSSFFVDEDVLLQERGPKAVEIAYRGDELPGGNPYPPHGEQRGTPTEMDWYYFFGTTFELDFNSLLDLFSSNGKNGNYGCPRHFK